MCLSGVLLTTTLICANVRLGLGREGGGRKVPKATKINALHYKVIFSGSLEVDCKCCCS